MVLEPKKPDIGGAWKSKRAEMGRRNYEIREKREKWAENYEFGEFREWGVNTGRADARRAREGLKGPFAWICVHLRSILAFGGLRRGSEGLKMTIWTANGRKWGPGTA